MAIGSSSQAGAVKGVAVEDGLGERIAAVDQLEGEEGGVLFQQAQEDLIALPEGQLPQPPQRSGQPDKPSEQPRRTRSEALP